MDLKAVPILVLQQARMALHANTIEAKGDIHEA